MKLFKFLFLFQKLEYTTQAPKASHASQIQEQLLQLLSAKSDEKAIFDVIDVCLGFVLFFFIFY